MLCRKIIINSGVCLHQGERVVSVGSTSCACGGTHVKNTSDIRGVSATKIKKVKFSHW